ncbi:cytochrome c nitrite reductase small subunit [Flammeovirga kamogawensis]|uniref:Cytochrome c nitrite reductase small subunit n=1 Tax=Flammeovirga kamogawensis TaxID=373891 RepID=A0ABX8GU41_9BACT|nr:cytochrome c nitrite reductase small subunit [Flammeovirga kamogawensis]MBB6459866.1 cytochrome c nitrite reductase small subunit [Flammeovirga kamogawensis]QWG07081.1 cytochrome c nitrite reductase small subunit [Flammeovirga kamogawensis]TRX68902.1 cytochrome c nitrite reductase small subunit [Flammeovirga kamogawensis]
MGKSILRYIIPPPEWRFAAIISIGMLAGVATYTLYVSNAFSYLSDDPKACVNCHLMAPEYATWQHSSHRENASCNDCHVPQDNIFNKYFFKAKDGLYHASMFTLRLEPQVIQIKEASSDVVQANCERCHNNLNENIGLLDSNTKMAIHGEGRLCWDCHREVPHGRVKSQSSTPNARVPVKGSPTPAWLKSIMDK